VVNLKWVLDRDKGTVAPPPEYLEFVKQKRREFFWLNASTVASVVFFMVLLACVREGAVSQHIVADVLGWNLVGMFLGGIASYMA
jgi:uncharacterized membrane protein (DUF485 family)